MSALSRRLRILTILICLVALVYFSSFLGGQAPHLPWFEHVWLAFTQIVVAFPQMIPLLIILCAALLGRRGGSALHLFLLMAAVSLATLGLFWSRLVIAAINS